MSTHTLPLVVLAGLLTTAAGLRTTASDDRPAPAPDPVATATSAAPASAHAHAHGRVILTPQILWQLAALHVLFAKYEDQQKAIEHGYAFVGPCVSDPVLGGMGDHYSRDADNDFGRGDGTYALERPQFLVYAPQKDGSRRLAALDYTVPYEKWNSDRAPEFFGIPFTRNDGFGVWMFHIWVFQHNPAGIFANFNPRVPQC
jgi:hypothetical protein